jgi:hypothetical protein
MSFGAWIAQFLDGTVGSEWESFKKMSGIYTSYIHWVATGGLEHLKIETRLIEERFARVMGECVTLK